MLILGGGSWVCMRKGQVRLRICCSQLDAEKRCFDREVEENKGEWWFAAVVVVG